MATSREEIRDWLLRAKKNGATHVIVVCDTFDHEDYPVEVEPGQDARAVYNEHNGKSMQRVMEVYDLRAEKAEQMNERRVMRLPQHPEKPS